MLGRGRREHGGDENQEPAAQEGTPSSRQEIDEEGEVDPVAHTGQQEGPPEGVRDQLERLASQIRGLQGQVEELVARRSDVVAEQASQRVAAIVQAAEASAAEITNEAHQEAAEMRERLIAEARADADRLRVEAQADASRIHTEAHAAAALLREQTLAEIRREVDRISEQLAEQLRVSAAQAIDAVSGGSPVAPPFDATPESEPSILESDEAINADVEEAVDELQSAAAVLEQSLRHLQELGQGLPEPQ